MTLLAEIENEVSSLLAAPCYGLAPEQRNSALLSLWRKEIAYACQQSPRFRNYVEQWPIDFRTTEQISELPYLPAAVFKANPPLALVEAENIKRTLTSSSTTGQIPSRVVIDAATARRMTRGVTTIIRDFIGSERRPYLVVDLPESLEPRALLGARSAAIQALNSFAKETVCCLDRDPGGDLCVNLEKLLSFEAAWKETEVLVYGFSHVIWNQFLVPLEEIGVKLHMPRVRVLHSGGWKRLHERSVTKDAFNSGVASLFGCSVDRITDYYGMVEALGTVYPDCERGNKHVPAFGDVIVRDPLTFRPVTSGNRGLVQVSSVLPTSFPGFLVLTDDIAELKGNDGCACGRRGTHFRFIGRAPKTELRGCGNLEVSARRGLLERRIA